MRMKKEVVLAIVLGLIAGVIVTFGIYTANRALQQRAEESITEQTPAPTAKTEVSDQKESAESTTTELDIETPETNSISTEDTITLRGTTYPNAIIVVFVNNTDYLISANATGKFATPIKLTAGSNTIIVVSKHPDTTMQAQAQRLVVFSTVDLDKSLPATPSALSKPTASPSPSPATRR